MGGRGRPLHRGGDRAPAAGKSTVGRLVASRFDPSVHLEADWFWTTIVSGFVPPWMPGADGQNQAMLRATMASAARTANGGYGTVVDGIIGPWYLELVGDELRATDVPTRYVVLRPSLDACLARAAGRAGDERIPGHKAFADEEVIRMMWDRFGDLGDHERCAIDTTGQTAKTTADEVCRRLVDGDRSRELG